MTIIAIALTIVAVVVLLFLWNHGASGMLRSMCITGLKLARGRRERLELVHRSQEAELRELVAEPAEVRELERIA
jgi:hypothetical protein